ncbi:MAG: response regulator [Candidatus Cloacimonetes bacterium]|nr:response regulator [Candidatus Cloacimonadota bacterium]
MITKKKIIIVEDEKIIAEDLKSTLISLGYNVIGSYSQGQTLIDDLASLSPDLILMDIMLHGTLSGIDTAELIMNKYDFPIIYVTAYANAKTLAHVKRTNPFGYIVKPFEERELHATIELAFSRHEIELERELQNKIQKSLLQASLNINSSIDIYTVEERIVSEVQTLLNAEETEIYFLDDTKSNYLPQFTINNIIIQNSEDITNSLILETTQNNKLSFFSDYENSRHYISVPLRIDENIIALIIILRKNKPFEKAEFTMIETFSTHASIVLKNAQIHDNLNEEIKIRKKAQENIKRRLAFEQTISEISSQFAFNPDLNSSIDFTLKKITERIKADHSFLLQYSDDKSIVQISHEYYTSTKAEIEPEKIPSSTLKNWIHLSESNNIIKIIFCDHMNEVDREILNIFRSKSIFAFPLKAKNRIIGFIVISFETNCQEWANDNTTFLRITSDILGKAIESNQVEEEKVFIQEQLNQSQKMEVVGKLAGGIAHDFNNLLTAINGYSEIALKKIDKTNPVTEDIEVIFSCGQKAAKLTQKLLGFSRKQIAHPIITDINYIIIDLGKMLERLIPTEMKIENNLSEESCIIKADPIQIEQIIANLVINARDAMKNSGTIKISTHNRIIEKDLFTIHDTITPGNYVVLEVEDYGSGIDPSIIKHIFEPFFTTKKISEGTGLGLSTVLGIIQQNNGYIDVKSEVNIGTKFYIYFPNMSHHKYQPIVLDSVIENIPAGTETILFLEDEENIKEFVSSILEEQGYKIICGNSGEEGLSLAIENNFKFDLLLADVRMPGISGPKLAQQLVNENQNIKILFISGHDNDELSNYELKGINHSFLQKPFTVASLTQKVRTTLDK